jgi:creatinine amidohydrolase
MTWPELRAALEGGGQVGLVPLGAIEQHGPHLPLATDAIVATALCERAGAASGALVMPTLSLGCSFGHGVDFPGTISLSPDLLTRTIRQYIEWAATAGLTKFLVVDAHMGNNPALRSAIDYLRLLRPDLQVGVLHWWEASPEVYAATVQDAADLHANRAETALMMAIAPDQVRLDQLKAGDDKDRTEGLVFQYHASALSKNGVTGRPSEATPELGQELLGAIVAEIANRVKRGRTEEPPLGRASPPRFTCL